MVTDGILLLQLGYRRNLTTLNGTNKYYVFHNMVQHLNGFEFKYSRIFLHQLSIMYFTIWWNWNGLESTYSGIILHDWSIMYCTIWCNLLMASNPNISISSVYLSHLKTFGLVKIWNIDIIITDKIYSNQNYKMLGNTLPLTAQIQGFWSFWGLIRALSKCPLLNSHPVH